MIDTRALDELTDKVQSLFGEMLNNFEISYVEANIHAGHFPRQRIDFRDMGSKRMMFNLSTKRSLTDLEKISYETFIDVFVENSLFAVH